MLVVLRIVRTAVAELQADADPAEARSRRARRLFKICCRSRGQPSLRPACSGYTAGTGRDPCRRNWRKDGATSGKRQRQLSYRRVERSQREARPRGWPSRTYGRRSSWACDFTKALELSGQVPVRPICALRGQTSLRRQAPIASVNRFGDTRVCGLAIRSGRRRE